MAHSFARAVRTALSGGAFCALASTPLSALTTSAYAGQTVKFTVSAKGTAPFTYRWYKNGTLLASTGTASLAFSRVALADAGSYKVVVANVAGTVTSGPVDLAVKAPVAPRFTQAPLSQSVPAGSIVRLSVVATGTPAPTLQWFKDGVALPGATAAILGLIADGPADAGTYTVRATNLAGQVVSAGARIEVLVSPVQKIALRELPPLAVSARGQTGTTTGPANLFDGRPETSWVDASAASWVLVDLGAALALDAYSLTSGSDFPAADPAAWTLSGSTDGKTWQVIEKRSGEAWSARRMTRDFVLPVRSPAYRWYRFALTPTLGTVVQLAEIEFFGP